LTELATHIKSDANRAALREKCGRLQRGEQITQFTSHTLADPGATLAVGSDYGQAFTLDESTRIQLEQALTVHVGPVARVLIKRTMKRARSLADLITALAAQVPDAMGRGAFQEAVRPLL
jgi:hypothetical protein